MKFAAGNQFWKSRSTHGCKPIFLDEENLWNVCCEYFEWVDDNPLIDYKVFIVKRNAVYVPVARLRAMSHRGLCLFLHISLATWRNYRRRPAFSEVVERVDMVIWVHNFEAAAARLLKANVVARELWPPSADP